MEGKISKELAEQFLESSWPSACSWPEHAWISNLRIANVLAAHSTQKAVPLLCQPQLTASSEDLPAKLQATRLDVASAAQDRVNQPSQKRLRQHRRPIRPRQFCSRASFVSENKNKP